MALVKPATDSDLVPLSEIDQPPTSAPAPAPAGDLMPLSAIDQPQPQQKTPKTDKPETWYSGVFPSAAEQQRHATAEQRRQQVEGTAPELADAPVANAVIAGSLTPGTLAMAGLRGGAHGIGPAIASGINFGVQQGLQDWVDRLLTGGVLDKHPYLKEILSTAGGLAAGAVVPGAEHLPGLRSPEARAQRGIGILQKIAQDRALSEPEEAASGSAQPIFEPQAGAEPKPIELPREAELVPLSEVTEPGAAPPEPQPVTLQPQQEIAQGVEQNNAPAVKEALHRELQRHPSASVYDMKVGDIKRDPERFQYKTNVSRATGADPALNDIQKYDRGLGGLLTVYHDADGSYYVANGHGRHTALERLEGPDATHRVQVIESRPPDDPEAVKGAVSYGKTPEQARGYGAIINIAEGRGTAMDAARFFRDQGMDTRTIAQAGIALNPTEEKTQRAVALSQLSPTLFRAVDTALVPERLGIVIGRELPGDVAAQDGLYQRLKKAKGGLGDLSASKLGDMIRLAKSSGETVQESMTLFGKEEMRKSLMSEQADIIGGIRSRLKDEKKLFGTVAEGAEELEAAGVGKVDADTGERLSTAAAHNLDLLNRTAYSSGPVNQVIRDAARQLSETPGKKAAIIKDAYGKVAEELGKIVPPPAEPTPQQGLFGAQPAAPPAPAQPIKPDEPMTLGVGLPIVQAAQRVYSVLPESIRNKPGEIGTALTRVFAPERESAFSQHAAEIKSSKAAELRARVGSTSVAVDPLRKYFAGLSKDDRIKLQSEMEQGNVSSLPKFLQPFGPLMKSITDAVHDRLSRLDPTRQIGYVDNYWRHQWADSPDKVRDAFNRIQAGSGKPLTEGAGFLKQRKFPTVADGVKAGLTPKFTNPVDQWLAGVQQEWRYATGKEMWNAIKDTGIAQFYRVTEAPPKEYAKIDDSITRVLTGTDKGVAHLGDWYVPKDVARVFNNYVRPGLDLGPLQSLSMLGNQVRVNFSAFHFLLTSLSDTAQRMGDQFFDGLGEIGQGKLASGTAKVLLSPARVAKAPVDVYRDWQSGRDTIAKALGGDFSDPAVHDAMLGGEGFNYAWNNPANIIPDTWRDVFGIPGALLERLNPIMKHWVAPLKVGMFQRLYGAALNRAQEAAGVTDLPFAQRRTIAYEVRQHIDNMMGQISRDNLHFSNGLKDSLHMVVAYPGWQIGTLRLIGGAARGVAKGAAQMAGARAPLDMQAQQALRYVTGMIMLGGTLGTIANYLGTGQMPKSVSEAFLWPTGEKDANGNEIRTEPPLYLARDFMSLLGHRRALGETADVMAWPRALGALAETKANWPLAAASYIWHNADFFGNPIYFPDLDSQPTQIRKSVAAILKEGATPFSFSNIKEMEHTGHGWARAAAVGLAGLTPESRALRQTAAENYVGSYHPPAAAPLSPDELKRRQVLSDFQNQVRKHREGGAPVDLTAIREAVRTGLVKPDQLKQRIEDAGKRPFAVAVSHVPIEMNVRAWQIAHEHGDLEDERDAARALMTHIQSGALLKLPPDQLESIKPILREFLQTMRGSPPSAPPPS